MTDPQSSPRRTNGVRALGSIRTKSVLLFSFVALLPATVVQYRLSAANRVAIEQSEQSLQAAVLAEVAGFVRGQVESTQADAKAIARTITQAAAANDASASLRDVKAAMAALTTVDTCRFEVPSAQIDTILRRDGVRTPPPPPSTTEQRNAAEETGMSQTLDADGLLLVVPTGESGANKGYVTVRLSSAQLLDGLRRSILNRFEGEDACLVVSDASQRVVASHCSANIAVGTPTHTLKVYDAFDAGAPRGIRVAVVREFVDRGEAYVGGVESISRLNWSLAVWRPKSRAYLALAALEREVTVVGGTALVLSIAIAFLAATAVTRPILRLAEQARKVARREWEKVSFESNRRDEIGDLSRAMETMVQSLQASEHTIAAEAVLRTELGRFLGHQLVEDIVRGEHALSLGGRRAEVTVMFADVVGFTPLAERLPPEQVVSLLNELFTLLSEVIFRHQGTIDKFVGDCLMAVWGTAVTQADHAQRALDTAEDILRFLETANADWSKRFGLELRLAIGINSGDVLVGNIGSSKRMDYTVIGDPVNVAARLEALAQPNQVLVGQRTAELAGDSYPLRPLGEHRLIGRGEPVQVFAFEVDA